MERKPDHKSDVISVRPPSCPMTPKEMLHLRIRNAFARVSTLPPARHVECRAAAFNGTVSDIRNLLDEFYARVLQVGVGNPKTTAVIKDFVDKGLRISGIEGDEAEDASKWAQAKSPPGRPYMREDEERFYFVAWLLLDKLTNGAIECANDSEHLFALQNLFDAMLEHKDGRLLVLILTSMNAIPQEDTKMMKDNMTRFADSQRTATNSASLSRLFNCDFNASRAMERIVLHEIDDAMYHPDGAKQAESRKWLNGIGFKDDEIDGNLASGLKSRSR